MSILAVIFLTQFGFYQILTSDVFVANDARHFSCWSVLCNCEIIICPLRRWSEDVPSHEQNVNQSSSVILVSLTWSI